MLECRVAQEDGTVLHLKGRLDGLGAPALQKEMELLVQQGHRTLQLDLGEVDFLSSAGLRVLLTGHRQLKAIGGKVLLRRLSAAAREVLVISGFEALFNLGEATGDQPDRGERHLSLLGHRFQVLEADAPAAPLHAWGNAGACERAAYVPEDVQPVPGLDWGLGLAALGRDWAQVRDFFGETVFLDGHAFVYPAIP
ncbi:MAG TPA: STAS domain-containing protein, partial [Holophaga sp.]|nr:STAS domain-containing protein [Holophaga sp.]